MQYEFSCTRTGRFPIGFRRFGGWQKELEPLIAWAKENRFGVIDIGRDAADIAATVISAGLRIGSADLLDWSEMISADPEKRTTAIEQNKVYIEVCGHAGVRNFFIVMIPEKPDLPRAENFNFMAASFAELTPVLEKHEARIVIEGWPGPGALCCTPETLRAMFERIPSRSMGINYDASHLVRMGIDPLRFLHEFVGRVHHVHAKDTEILTERLYMLGTEQQAVFTPNARWGGNHWRYTIPGHGMVRWSQTFKILADAGYKGCVSIELEDGNFNGAEDTEKAGLLLSRSYLENC